MGLWTLILSGFRLRRLRTTLTLAAVALAVSLVVAVMSGYAATRHDAQRFLRQYIGAADAFVVHESGGGHGLTQALLDELRADAAVQLAVGRLETTTALLDSEMRPITSYRGQLVGIDRPSDVMVENQPLLDGRWFDDSGADLVVIDQVLARILKDPNQNPNIETAAALRVGDSIHLPTPDGPVRLRIAAIVRKPGLAAMLMQSIYAPLPLVRRAQGPVENSDYSRFILRFHEGVDQQAFAERWRTRLGQVDPRLRLKLMHESQKELDDKLQGLRMMSWMGGAVAMLAAAFIIFSTLSMGVAERQRALATLRAVGATRGQVVWLVLAEAVLLAAAGCLVGLALGALWVWLLAMAFPAVFDAVVVSGEGMLLAAAGSLVASLLAALAPAIRAGRASPLDAMSPLVHAGHSSWRATARCAIIALPLLLLDIALQTLPLGVSHLARDIRFWGHFVVGIPAIMAGMFLLSPLLVRLADSTLSRPVSAMLRLPTGLLNQQLSSGLWRAAGTATALMVGLAVLLVMQTHGRSMLSGWQLPTQFPDLFVFTFKPGGMEEEDLNRLRETPGIKEGKIAPVAIARAQLADRTFAITGVGGIEERTMFLGVDPDLTLEMARLDFRSGDVASAQRLLRQGRHVLITQEFQRLRRIDVGGTLTFLDRNGQRVDYTVAGVVWSPGIDVMVAVFDMGRQMETQTIASVFGTVDDARNDFAGAVRLFAANVEGDADRAAITSAMQQRMGLWGLLVADVRRIKADIVTEFNRLIDMAATIALAAMLVASLGVANTVMAGIRTRQWQFGILRSVGASRGLMLRLVLGEALLLGLAGALLGTLCGGLLSLVARLQTASMTGYVPPFVVVWDALAIGWAATLGVSLLASLLPARALARSDTLSLLQAGRSGG